MKRLHLILILPFIFLGLPVAAQQTSIVPQTQGEVTYVSGGVGDDEREVMKTMRADYNLSLLFTVKGTGEYISDAKVCIKDAHGAVLLETVVDGPMLYAKLKPGHYSISVDRDGHVMKNRVTLSGKKLTALSFALPAETGD